KNAGENRQDPISGLNLHVSLDYNIQMYAQQAAKKVMKEKSAENVCIILLNPKNGEIMAMVQVPEFNLNEPFKIVGDKQNKIEEDTIGKEKNTKKQQNKLNQMWRNTCLNDTYEPGSIFKIVTTAAAFEAGVLKETDQFYCPGYKVVEDRRIHCHQVRGHGAETFVDGIKNSCNPVFIEVGMRLGVERFYSYFDQFGILNKTGIDLPGEARTIMHAKEKMGQVELATVSFGQSFQITPIQLAATAASLLNGGTRITPHLGVSVSDAEGKTVEEFKYKKVEKIVSEETSAELCSLLEKVVSEGTGNKAYLEGYRIGGKTATSQTLPRSRNRYISSFLGFYPADDPQVLALITITNPKGIYYGGTIAAPVIRDIFQNIIPYMGVAFQ
ncbi:MAG: penicillin-binding transpeptidase domain-containing protein, partial [Lachnospiraceae bacterium]